VTEAEEERMDRLEEALHRVAAWAEAYPFTVFPKSPAAYWQKAHVVTQIARIARTALERSGQTPRSVRKAALDELVQIAQEIGEYK